MAKIKENDHIILLGAGLVGSLLATVLAKKGFRVSIYERRPDMRKAEMGGGRSINLALSDRGLKALRTAGLIDLMDGLVVPMKGRMMHDPDGQLTYQPYGKEGQAINSVSRSGLNAILMDAAEEAGAEIHFDSRCLDVDFATATVTMEQHGKEVHATGDLVIGTDGAFSAVRTAMMKTDRFNYQQQYIPHGYKELTIPATPDGSHQLETNYLHIWPRKDYMLIALPNLDGSFTCTLFFPFEGEPSFASLDSPQAVRAFFEEVFPDATQLMPTLEEDFFNNPTSSLVSITCDPWQKEGKVAIMGDASHAIVPFYGQGMNSGFEDVSVFESLLAEHRDWEELLKEFEALRKPDAIAIRDLALHNFIEMRDKVADDSFLLRKKIEGRLHELYPKEWIPLYSMVTFAEDIRYSEALHTSKLQDKVMRGVMRQPNLQAQWEQLDFAAIMEDFRKEKAASA